MPIWSVIYLKSTVICPHSPTVLQQLKVILDLKVHKYSLLLIINSQLIKKMFITAHLDHSLMNTYIILCAGLSKHCSLWPWPTLTVNKHPDTEFNFCFFPLLTES